MGRFYTSLEDFEKSQEEEFKNKVIEIGYYTGNRHRTTLDGEWTEEELKEDIYDEAVRILKEDKVVENSKYKALYDRDLLLPEYIVENICDRFDLIEVYNKAYDMHRNDKPMKFGIRYFDELARKEIRKILKENEVNTIE